MSVGIWGLIHLIGHIFMMQMDSFLLRVLIRVLELISVPNHSRDSFTLIKFNTLSSCPEIVSVFGVSGVVHLIGHTFMMQMDSFNFGF